MTERYSLKKLFALSVLLVLGLAAPAPAQDPPPVAVQISEFVRRIFQDSRGDMWFGTNGDGVIRYDGTSFVNLTQNLPWP